MEKIAAIKPYRITIHCSASQNNKPFWAKDIISLHQQKGWTTMGYHLVIQPSGEVEPGRPLNEQGAHVVSDNEGNIGICMVGNDKFTALQFEALRRQLDSITRCFDIPRYKIYCHNQFFSAQKQGKTCPNISINELLCWYILHDEGAIAPYLLNV